MSTTQRSNYTEPKFSLTGEEMNDESGGGGTGKDRMRSSISDKSRKSSASIRKILLYRKNLSTLVDELVSPSLAASIPPTDLPHSWLAVFHHDQGWGTIVYHSCCSGTLNPSPTILLCMRLLGKLCLSEMRHALLPAVVSCDARRD